MKAAYTYAYIYSDGVVSTYRLPRNSLAFLITQDDFKSAPADVNKVLSCIFPKKEVLAAVVGKLTTLFAEWE